MKALYVFYLTVNKWRTMIWQIEFETITKLEFGIPTVVVKYDYDPNVDVR